MKTKITFLAMLLMATVSTLLAAPDSTAIATMATTSTWAFITANWGIIATVLFGISELLASIPAVKSNSLFQLLFGWLKTQTPVGNAK